MSAEDYGYSNYEQMFRHASGHGGGIDADSNVVEWVVSLLDTINDQEAEIDRLQKSVKFEKFWHDEYAKNYHATGKVIVELEARIAALSDTKENNE
jgi:hypothetical protein